MKSIELSIFYIYYDRGNKQNLKETQYSSIISEYLIKQS